MKTLLTKFNRYHSTLPIFIAIAFILFFTIPALFDTNHFMYNLEPYPDGLLYTIGAKKLLETHKLSLTYLDQSSPVWTAPLYPMLLSFGYFLNTDILTYFVINIFFLVGGVILLDSIVKETIRSKYVHILVYCAYLLNGAILWLPSLPLSENASLFFFILFIYSYFLIDSRKNIFIVAISIAGMLITRYASFPIALACAMLALTKNAKGSFKVIANVSLVFIILIGVFEAILQARGSSIMQNILRIFSNSDAFFSLKYILENLWTYIGMLLFNSGYFLWKKIGLSNIMLFGLFITSCLYLLFKTNKRNQAHLLITLFLSLFPLQLIFYSTDARYIIYSIPLIALGIGWLIEAWPEKRRALFFLTVLGIFLQLFMQRSFVKEIIASNIFGRSTAWQYEAVLHFNRQSTDSDLIITALPPFLVDTYQTKPYRVLPLSHHQEFLDKQQYVWGSDIAYDDLIGTYTQWLEEGRPLYITNAYITHQQAVIEDYENYKNYFDFELVSEGCEQACNIYKLSLKEETL